MHRLVCAFFCSQTPKTVADILKFCDKVTFTGMILVINCTERLKYGLLGNRDAANYKNSRSVLLSLVMIAFLAVLVLIQAVVKVKMIFFSVISALHCGIL